MRFSEEKKLPVMLYWQLLASASLMNPLYTNCCPHCPQVSYILRGESSRSDALSMLAILSILLRCDTSSVWIVQRIVEYALQLAAVLEAAPESGSEKERLIQIAAAMQQKCGATIRMDVSLTDRLQEEGHQHANGVKANVCSVLLVGNAGSCMEAGDRSRSISTMFRLTQSELSSRHPATKDCTSARGSGDAAYAKLQQFRPSDNFATSLKSVCDVW